MSNKTMTKIQIETLKEQSDALYKIALIQAACAIILDEIEVLIEEIKRNQEELRQ